jgi:hypothetical protein
MSSILRLVLAVLATGVVGAAVPDRAEAACSWLEQRRYHGLSPSRAVPGLDPRTPVSRKMGAAISAQIAFSIGLWNCRDISISTSPERGVNPPGERQYQTAAPEDRRREAMLEIGALLGLLYLAFLACWFWATRLRHGSRH